MPDFDVDATVIGGGFGGCLSLIKLREQGLTTKLLEAGSEFGGVWHWNQYPGARVDSDVPIYQLSDKRAWKNFNFRTRFPDYAELQEYFANLDKAFDLRKDAVFNAVVNRVQYDDSSQRWLCTLRDGRLSSSRYLILAVGSSIKQYIPDLPGRELFKGSTIHSARWPKDLDVKGKKVGLLGNGATAVQIIQELAKQDCHLTVFIRTPCTAFPMRQRQITEQEAVSSKGFYDAIFDRAKKTRGAFPHNRAPRTYQEDTPEQRKALWDGLFTMGGLQVVAGNYDALGADREANAGFYEYWVQSVRSRMKDEAKKDVIAPLKQMYPILSKRPPLEQDYYECMDRPNVEVVNLRQTPIQRFTETGLVTGSGDEEKAHELDMVIFATGYDAITGSVLDLNISDRNGIMLQDKWKEGVKTNLGMMVSDMPNMFMLYGPQAPTPYTNGPPFMELQMDWVDGMMRKAKSEGKEIIETTSEAAEQWAQRNKAIADMTIMDGEDSWYNGANIPGKRREPLAYLGGMPDWWTQCEEVLRDLKGIKLSSSQ